jgi:serine/threonine protein kinase/Tfp pilus assembly protein PilF
MGVVYEAEDTRLGRRVALKFLPEHLCSDDRASGRFQREAQAASSLNHPNICTIYDIGERGDQPFISMELLEGESLKERIERGPLPLSELLDVALQVTEGLIAAHAGGIIHRDIKPGNIFLTTRGQVKILDFGLAKVAPVIEAVAQGIGTDSDGAPTDETQSLSGGGLVPGTAFYMSPEQARGETVDARSDIFSLGIVLYEAATGKKPFAKETSIKTLAAIMEEKPVSPTIANPTLPHEFEIVIGKALEKKKEGRYQSVTELRADLQKLKQASDSDGVVIAKPQAVSLIARASGVFRRLDPSVYYILLGMAGFFVTVLVVVTLWWAHNLRSMRPGALKSNTLAVLPFQNAGGDSGSDFLKVALADEVTNILTYTPSLEVRPVPTKLNDMDPQKAGRELKVAYVVTGHYLRERDNLVVTLEAIDVNTDRILWQQTVKVPANDSIKLQTQLENQVRQGLLPVLGAAAGSMETATKPKNPEAYDLYLRAAAVSHDPGPNKQAIAMLERSVALDPSYAPAWDALGFRYYYDSQYASGGEIVFDRAGQAYQKALSLDPNYITAYAHLARSHAEHGSIDQAFVEAEQLVKRRPDNSQAHFTMAYVLRYAGLLGEAGKECDAALALDPGNYGLRSCAFAFFEQGKTQRAMDYLALDAGSEWYRNVLPAVLLREGALDQAREASRKMSNNSVWFGNLLQACVTTHPSGELAEMVNEAAVPLLSQRDPEFRYYQGAILAYCGQLDMASQLIKSAIEQNYCASAALDYDPLLQKLRLTPRFTDLRKTSLECQKSFLVARNQGGR